MTGDRARIARALGYPYQRPVRPYVYNEGRALAWSAKNLGLCRSNELTPVLAVGSNAALEQLTRKFGQDSAVVIPVTTGRLIDHDVVFAAYMTSYGSLPATLVSRPGCIVEMAITWLDDRALARMHQTESVGEQTLFGRLEGLVLEGPIAMRPDLNSSGRESQAVSSAFTYRSCLGELSLSGAPVGLWELGASGRTEAALTQQGIQRRLRRWMETTRLRTGEPPEASFAEWVYQNTLCTDRQAQATRWLQQRRMQLPLPAFNAVSVTACSG